MDGGRGHESGHDDDGAGLNVPRSRGTRRWSTRSRWIGTSARRPWARPPAGMYRSRWPGGRGPWSAGPPRGAHRGAAPGRRSSRWPGSTSRPPGGLAAALQERAAGTDARTVNRELSALRSAVAWWQDQRWISGDPTAGLHQLAGPRRRSPRSPGPRSPGSSGRTDLARSRTVAGVVRRGRPVRRGPRAERGRLDLARNRVRPAGRRPAPAGPGIGWGAPEPGAALADRGPGGRAGGVTGRRAPAGTPAGYVCPLTGRARMSYRRAAEIFTDATRPLDPAGRGWTLSLLRP